MSAPPIPLSAPDGTVYAYACPRCRKVRANGEFLVPHNDELVARIAEDAREQTDACCRCTVCRADVDPCMLWPRECPACKPAQDAKRAAAEVTWAAKAARDAEVQEASLALARDRTAATTLCQRMSDISEDHYCAGWIMGLEFTLWTAVLDGGAFQFGMGEVNAADVAELRRLSEACGGWWRFDHHYGELFVPLEEWLRLYQADRTAT